MYVHAGIHRKQRKKFKQHECTEYITQHKKSICAGRLKPVGINRGVNLCTCDRTYM